MSHCLPVIKMKRILEIGSLIILPLICAGHVFPQEPVPVTKNYVDWAQGFLQVVYPVLKDQKYTISLVSYEEFDKRAEPAKAFDIYIGKGPKYEYTRVIAGFAGTTPPPPDFHPGPQYPEQVLTTGFRFDALDHLIVLNAYGTAIGKPEAEKYLTAFMSSHPDATDADVVVELKRVGAKYEPSNKEEFVKSIPIAKLDRFLGRLEVISVEFIQGGWAQISVLGFWRVVAKVEQSNGTVLKYNLTFEQFNGDLTSITTLPN
jgi:hypothetical protein